MYFLRNVGRDIEPATPISRFTNRYKFMIDIAANTTSKVIIWPEETSDVKALRP